MEQQKKLSPGSLVQYINKKQQKIIWMIIDEFDLDKPVSLKGVVIHSDNLIALGTVTDLTLYELQSFLGSVTINSAKST